MQLAKEIAESLIDGNWKAAHRLGFRQVDECKRRGTPPSAFSLLSIATALGDCHSRILGHWFDECEANYDTSSAANLGITGIGRCLNRRPSSGLELLDRANYQSDEITRFMLTDQTVYACLQNNRMDQAEAAINDGLELAYRRQFDPLRIVQAKAAFDSLCGKETGAFECLEQYEDASPVGSLYREEQLQKEYAHLELCIGRTEIAASHLSRALDACVLSNDGRSFDRTDARFSMDDAMYMRRCGDIQGARDRAETAVEQIVEYLRPSALLDAFVLYPLLHMAEPAIALNAVNRSIKCLSPPGDEQYECFVAPTRGSLMAIKARLLLRKGEGSQALAQIKAAFDVARTGANALAFSHVLTIFQEILAFGPYAMSAGAAKYFEGQFNGFRPASYVWRDRTLWMN